METAHQFGSEITGVQFAYDNRMLATRSNDETLKLWDVRSVDTSHSSSRVLIKLMDDHQK